MHIAFNGWFWDQPNTGSGQYLRNLLAQLRRVGPDHRLTLIVPTRTGDLEQVPQGIEVVRVNAGGGNPGKVMFEQRGYPAAVKRLKADIAHVPYWGPPLSSPARLVTSILDVIPLEMPVYASSLGAKLYTSLVTAASRGSAHVITLSQAAKDDIVKHLSLPPEMITPIHLGVEERFHPRMGAERDTEVRRKYGLPDDFVLYLGGFDRRKSVNELLLAYTYVAQGVSDKFPLVLAGKQPTWGSSPVFPDLPAYAKELGIDDLVQWTGYVEEADKPSFYRMARVFAYPTRYEGFGLPALEAMASGTPVVAQDIPVMQELVGDGAFLVASERKMAGSIIALLEQESFRQSMVNQGLAQATRYSWRKTARETLAVYEKVMAL